MNPSGFILALRREGDYDLTSFGRDPGGEPCMPNYFLIRFTHKAF
jgi:hypothetical protein